MMGINLNPLNCTVNVNECLSGLWRSRWLARPKSAIKKLKKEMDILKAKRDDIKNQIKEKIPTNEVNQWLQDVDILEGEVADIEQDFQTMRCCSCSCFSCSCFNKIGGTSSRTQKAGDQVPIRKSSNYCSIILRVVDKLEDANGLKSRHGELNPIVTDLSRLEFGIQKLEKEMARLRAKRDDIKKEITDKEREEGKIPTKEVSQWLVEVETLEGQVTGIELDFQSISCFSCNNCFNQTGGTSSQTQQVGDQVSVRESSNCCSINRRVTKKLGEANELMSRASQLDPIATDLSRLESGIQKLEKEMTRLRAKRDDIKKEITDKEREEGTIPTKEVSQWLLEVETLEGQVTGIKLNFQSISCFSCNNCFNQTGGTSTQTQQAGDQVLVRESSNCCSINQTATEKLREANELMSRASQLNPIVTVGLPEPTAMLPISYQSPVGIDSYVEDIVGYIDGGGEGNIIGIHGMGGIGKSTILKSIKQHYLSKHTRFDRVIWVVASKDHQLKRLQMDIAKELRLNTLQENDDDKTCGKKLFDYLNNRNCLLLLDDIWEHVDLQLLGMAHSATKQGQQQQQSHKVVVFTTRKETMCVQMKAKKEIKVTCLDPVQAWQLFEENSNKDVLSSDAGIKFVATELAKECAGLPLALITVARAMSGKKSWKAWQEALTKIRDKHQWTTICLPEDSRDMYKIFQLSYDSLENDSLRKCLLCCALWPEDYEIDIFKQLIPCWIGCGIIRDFDVINEAFTEGCLHLEALMAASLLEKCSQMHFPYKDTGVKMHDIIRDMALLMVSGLEGSKRKWIVKAGIGLSDLPRQEEWQEAERASFMMNNNITSLQDYGASTFPKLSMLILCNNKGLKTIPPNLFASMPHLTYLDLSDCRITELPKEICSLTELQYLNLSFNQITRLPVEFGCLSKLECLLLRGTNLEIIPNGIISNLSMLKWLDITFIDPAAGWWYDELKCFKGRHRLSVEINIIATTDNIERLNMLSNVSIWKLTLYRRKTSGLPNYDLGTPQWGCRTGDKLECLCIRNIGLDRLELAASIGSESSFSCLEKLEFIFHEQLEEISLNRVRLYNLRELYIFNCPMLKDVSWILQLPCLSILDIDDCYNMKELIADVGKSNNSSSIQKLKLAYMPSLNRIANRQLQFPYLEYMCVTYCPSLKNLSFGAEMSKNCRLKSIEGDDSWWNNLDWDDESIKDSLTPYFR